MSSHLKVEQDPLLLSGIPASPGPRHSSVSVGRTYTRPKQHSTRRASSIAVIPAAIPLLPSKITRPSANDGRPYRERETCSSPMKKPRMVAAEDSIRGKHGKGKRWTLSPTRRTVSQTSFCGSDDPLAGEAEDTLIIQSQHPDQEAYWKDREPDRDDDEEEFVDEEKMLNDTNEDAVGVDRTEEKQSHIDLHEQRQPKGPFKEEEDKLVEKKDGSIQEESAALDEELKQMIGFKVQALLEEVMAGLRDELHERIVANLFVGMSVDPPVVHAFLAPQLKKLRSNIVHAVLMRSTNGKEEKGGEDEPPHIAFVLNRIGTLMDNLTRSVKEGYVTRLLAAWPPTLDRVRAEKTAREIVEVNEWSPGIGKLVQMCVEKALMEEQREG